MRTTTRMFAAAAVLLSACGTTHEIGGGVTTATTSGATTTCTSAPSTTTGASTTAPVTTAPATTAPATTTATVPATTVPHTVAPTVPATTVPHTVAPTVPATTVPHTVAPTVPPTTGPHAGQPSKVVWQLPTSQLVVAITFDAGSDLGFTNAVLDTLRDKGVHATFGITGAWAAAHPDAVRRMVAEGHQVMNHSYSHRSFTGASAANPLLTAADRQADLAKAEATLGALIGCSTMPFWRPPYGDTDASVLADVGAAGYRYTIMWTVDSGGWKGLPADEIVNRVTSKATPGAILAFHVGSASQDSAALARIIDQLRGDGYAFVTLAGAYGQ